MQGVPARAMLPLPVEGLQELHLRTGVQKLACCLYQLQKSEGWKLVTLLGSCSTETSSVLCVDK